jgi:hypothetical protein
VKSGRGWPPCPVRVTKRGSKMGWITNMFSVGASGANVGGTGLGFNVAYSETSPGSGIYTPMYIPSTTAGTPGTLAPSSVSQWGSLLLLILGVIVIILVAK